MQNLELACEVYHMHYISDRAVLFDSKGDGFVLMIDRQWVEVKTQPQWATIVRNELRRNATSFGWRSMTGFEEVRDPAGNHYGFLTHAGTDLVSLRVVDACSIRLRHVMGGHQEEEHDSAESHAQLRRPSPAGTTIIADGRN